MPFEIIGQNDNTASLPTIAIIDDEFTSRIILDKIVRSLQKEVFVQAFASPLGAIDWLRLNHPDLILVDHLMDEMSGLDVVKTIRRVPHLEHVPIIMVTVSNDNDIRHKALDLGVSEFLTKPFNHYECQIRCRNLLALQLHHKEVLYRSEQLEKAVTEATRRILEREQETLFRLAKAGEYRDSDTGNHVLRMAKFSRLIAEGMGLDENRCSLIEMAAPMHDIGKIGIPDNILLKPGKLNHEEFSIMKTHSSIGYHILKSSHSKYISLGAEIALSHHERYDGSGYPNGLKGKAIPLDARIVAVADVFDALTSERPYKKAWSNQDAVEFIYANKGSHFDPGCVEAFMLQFSKISLIQQQLQDTTPSQKVQVWQ
ncbi:HD domain-containing phosphohydrolase [Sideroxydans lithotrophicus]|uniref:Response regulator receiver modulated metal dependent phosphohydrolase n=1 Tax=Sideroxydans lithotrophicus (strain ES-1) TaxID=580332 RepID=D5CRE1_SIDLE|nr:HD domain-containing phosphohydrolase [Sideroxydans lithotrophicus]ADE11527.1 response regulator receiver modulated metal dependent phosphohydrolase [Sideroxydans lithotrophicus ES-1]